MYNVSKIHAPHIQEKSVGNTIGPISLPDTYLSGQISTIPQRNHAKGVRGDQEALRMRRKKNVETNSAAQEVQHA